MNHSGQPSGFSLTELVIVMAIMGILAAMAASRVVEIREESQINAAVSEANRLNQLAMTARAIIGRWPNDASHGVVPVELRSVLFEDSFKSGTPIGGLWDWNGEGRSTPMGFAINFATTRAEPVGTYAKIDGRFDDGNPETGKIQRRDLGRIFWCFLVE